MAVRKKKAPARRAIAKPGAAKRGAAPKRKTAIKAKTRAKAARKTPRRGRPPSRQLAPKTKAAARRKAVVKSAAGAPPPPPLLTGIVGYWVSQCIYSVAKLGVADIVAKTARTPEEIAAATGAHATTLYRVLRALASIGLFAEDTKGRFKLTRDGQLLRSDHPASLRSFALMIIDDWNWSTWAGLAEGVTTGERPFEKVMGQSVFAFLHQNPEKERVFMAAMASISGSQNDAVAAGYPFSDLKTLVDVGGAHGHMLAAILKKHKKLKGVLYDQPQVVEGAAASGFVTDPKLKGRCTIAGGDFFEAVPQGADGYIMKYIIHDWDDEKCIKILSLCREAMAPKGRVLVVEGIVAGRNKPDWTKFLDVNMFVGPGGKERTREEFARLFAAAGLKLKRIHPTASPMSILEAVRA